MLESQDLDRLAIAGRALQNTAAAALDPVDILVVEKLLGQKNNSRKIAGINLGLREAAKDLCRSRQRCLP